MTDDKELPTNEENLRKNAGSTEKENPTAQPLEKDQKTSDEEESDLEQQRKEALTERD